MSIAFGIFSTNLTLNSPQIRIPAKDISLTQALFKNIQFIMFL